MELHRKICIKKDVMEIRLWMQTIEYNNSTLSHFIALEKQLIKEQEIASALMGMRRKNTLVMGAICKYEQELKKEFSYGKMPYDTSRFEIHERKRESFNELQEKHTDLINLVCTRLRSFARS
jgi:hypothetical protein